MILVESWRCTRDRDLQEPILVVRTLDGEELQFMMPGRAAEAMGLALIEQGRQALPSAPPN
jgi:hypothetical protein